MSTEAEEGKREFRDRVQEPLGGGDGDRQFLGGLRPEDRLEQQHPQAILMASVTKVCYQRPVSEAIYTDRGRQKSA